MHKKIQVASLEISDETGYITKIYELYNPIHLPVGVGFNDVSADRAALNVWWDNRSIPASRDGIKEALEILGINDSKILLMRCYGLSLSDQYWMCPGNSNTKWEDINYFDNPFSDDIGDILIGSYNKKNAFDFNSPDNTSDGNLKKRWKIINGDRCLVKGGSKPFLQEPVNEKISALICRRLEIPHTDYETVWNADEPYSVCRDFIDADTELVGAWRVLMTQKRANDVSVYTHYTECCRLMGIKNIEQSLDRMIVLDYIIANEDRHLNNFGLIRNAETLEWLAPAPIYDSGGSLGYNSLTSQIRSGYVPQCKPFKTSHEEQLKLVTSFEWLDFKKLYGIEDDVKEILSSPNIGKYIDVERRNAIISLITKRIDFVCEAAVKKAVCV